VQTLATWGTDVDDLRLGAGLSLSGAIRAALDVHAEELASASFHSTTRTIERERRAIFEEIERRLPHTDR
jgi:hypothetical protein